MVLFRTICEAILSLDASELGPRRPDLLRSGPMNLCLFVVHVSGGKARRLAFKDREKANGLWSSFCWTQLFLYLLRDFGAEDRRWHLRAGSSNPPKRRRFRTRSGPGSIREARLPRLRRAGRLLAQRFDAATLRLSGRAVTLAERIYYFNGPAQAGFSASQTGVVSYEKLAAPSRVAWLDRSGRESRESPSTGSSGRRAFPRRPCGRGARLGREVRHERRLALRPVARLPLRLTLGVRRADAGMVRGRSWIFLRGDQFGPPDIWTIPSSRRAANPSSSGGTAFSTPRRVSGRALLVLTEWSRKTTAICGSCRSPRAPSRRRWSRGHT